MARVFFNETFFSHGVMKKKEAEVFSNRAKAAGFKTILRKKVDGFEVFLK